MVCFPLYKENNMPKYDNTLQGKQRYLYMSGKCAKTELPSQE